MDKRAKCEKCQHCKAIARNAVLYYDIVICDYWNELRKSLISDVESRPKYCGRFTKKKKGGNK